MKKTKLQKGITLIALIITIVVLLIIAVVTIGAIQESGIITHAQNAKSEYTIAQEKERITLAYSEYQIQKTLNSQIEPDTLSVDEATTEPISDLGWKVTYADTGNVYGINSKGEYDEAVTIIIEASETTGLGLDCFLIYEDLYAINENKKAGSITMPEKYVFYNWSKLTLEQIETIETTYTPKPGTEKVCNASNRLFNLDVNGDGKFDISDYNLASDYPMDPTIFPMKSDKHDKLAEICIRKRYQ